MPILEKRQLGRTKLHVTTLGLGTATMGGSRFVVTPEARNGIVTAAWDAGAYDAEAVPVPGVALDRDEMAHVVAHGPSRARRHRGARARSSCRCGEQRRDDRGRRTPGSLRRREVRRRRGARLVARALDQQVE